MRRSLAITLGVLGAMILVSPLAVKASRKAFTPHDTRLALYFPHEKHNQKCVFCHHANPGLNNTTPCVTCHRSQNVKLKLSVEPRFHAFCRECHAEQSREDHSHGPVRDCAGCHRPNTPP